MPKFSNGLTMRPKSLLIKRPNIHGPEHWAPETMVGPNHCFLRGLSPRVAACEEYVPRGGRRHDACWVWHGPSPPARPLPSRVAIRLSGSREKQQQRRAEKGGENCLNSKRPESKPPHRRAASSAVRSPLSRAPFVSRTRAGAEHASRPQPLRRGQRRRQPLLREPNQNPLSEIFSPPTQVVW